MDAHENIYWKSIGRMLTDGDGLNMKEVVGEFTGKQVGAMYFRGSTPINAVWATTDVEVVGACIMPAGFSIGDHRQFQIDFQASSWLGAAPQR